MNWLHSLVAVKADLSGENRSRLTHKLMHANDIMRQVSNGPRAVQPSRVEPKAFGAIFLTAAPDSSPVWLWSEPRNPNRLLPPPLTLPLVSVRVALLESIRVRLMQ